MENRTKFAIDAIQWLLIVALSCLCVRVATDSRKRAEEFAKERTETTYKLVYYGQSLQKLKKENEDLYRVVDSVKNVESAVEIRYIYKYKTDTVYVEQMKHDAADSTYEYRFDNDTVRFNMTAKANDLKWMQGNFEVKDSFQLITKNEYGQYTTWLNHSSNVEIENIDVWHRKQKWYEHLHYGPAFGLGYGLVNQKFDFFVGGAVSYEF